MGISKARKVKIAKRSPVQGNSLAVSLLYLGKLTQPQQLLRALFCLLVMGRGRELKKINAVRGQVKQAPATSVGEPNNKCQ